MIAKNTPARDCGFWLKGADWLAGVYESERDICLSAVMQQDLLDLADSVDEILHALEGEIRTGRLSSEAIPFLLCFIRTHITMEEIRNG